MREQLLRGFCSRLNSRFWEEIWRDRMAGYQRRPKAFAERILGSKWWGRQADVARMVASGRRTAVKSANGVGKTYLAADLALWFLYAFQPSVVLTTAPTWRQVRNLLWEELRRRFRMVRTPLPGRISLTRLQVEEGWFAFGLSTDDAVRFQGFHAENLLIILDEASGVPETIWDAAEGIAVGGNNRILAIGNPLTPSGRFYRIFRAGRVWARLTISALEHPNVTGEGTPIPGAVTAEAVEERIAEWCEPVEADANSPLSDQGAEKSSPASAAFADTFEWKGRRYLPNNLFRTRVLGEFPDSDDESLIPLRWIEAAMGRTLSAEGVRRMAADVARFGGDATVIGVRVGATLTYLKAIRGADLMEVTGAIARIAFDCKPESIAVDSIGLGAGVVDRLVETNIQGVEPVNAALPARDSERFANRRAEMYWALRERFRSGEIALPPEEEMKEQLASLRYRHTSRGQIQMESKEEMKRRGLHSPDHADMLAMLYDGGAEIGEFFLQPRPIGRAERLRAEMW